LFIAPIVKEERSLAGKSAAEPILPLFKEMLDVFQRVEQRQSEQATKLIGIEYQLQVLADKVAKLLDLWEPGK
jgi:hypothetical protein